MRLKDKTAIVTGAAHGIGRAIALAFAREGAAVLVADVDEPGGEETAALIRKEGLAATFVQSDVSDEAQVIEAVRRAAAKNGRIDVLCNNAAYIAKWHSVSEAPREEWDRNYNISLMGYALFMKHALPHMLPHHAGSIINIASVRGMVGALASAPYTSMKHAIIGLTRSAAYDYGPQNIRVNAIAPGPIDTRNTPEDGSEKRRRQMMNTMLGRSGSPEEVAPAAVFLASDESSYVTGTVLPVDGGWTAM
jgi:NAD(P)-dependent dehydrogenase (short-subunit alcohol dehydrogenase family)